VYSENATSYSLFAFAFFNTGLITLRLPYCSFYCATPNTSSCYLLT